MPEEYSSPEEKLLRLIRGEKKPKDRLLPPSEKEKPVSRKEDQRPAAPAPKRSIAAPAQQPKGGRDYIKFVNIALIAVLVVIAGVLLADSINFKLRQPAYVTEVAPEIPPHKVPSQREPERASEPQPPSNISGDSDALISRDLFRPPLAAPTNNSATNVSQVPYEKLKDLSLKGIIAGDKPQAIIEDEKNKKSYFLYKGESVNDIKVEDIQPDRVILRVNGELLELTL